MVGRKDFLGRFGREGGSDWGEYFESLKQGRRGCR